MTPLQVKGSKGQPVNAEQMRFEIIKEGVSEYKLSNGQIMKIRTVLAEVYRLDEKDEATGKDNYFIKSGSIVSVEDAENK